MVRRSNNWAINSLADRQNSVFLGNKLEKTIEFEGGAGKTGEIGIHDLLEIEGVVAMQLFAVCETDLVGATSTIKVGTADTDAGLIAQTDGPDIDEHDIWHDSSPSDSIELTSIATQKIVTDDVIYTIGTADITAGKVKFIVLWSPITVDGNVKLA